LDDDDRKRTILKLQFVKYEKIENVARITMSRPERANALNDAMLDEIVQAVSTAEADGDIRAVVLTGDGKAFSSGFDLKDQMERRPTGISDWRPILQKDFDAVVRFWLCPKPTIASVRGACLAGAFEMSLACDMTIASDTAFFGEPELKFGAGIVVMLLPWLVGPKIAKEIIFTGEDRIPAQRAYELGVVNKIVAEDKLDDAALKLALYLSKIDPMLMRETKRAINKSFEMRGMLEALQAALDVDLQIESEGSPDKLRFFEIARASGLKAALTWRDGRFPDLKR
jgi:enoyl-CoA hydratase